MKIIGIKTLLDNYIWIIYNLRKQCIIIDPNYDLNIVKKKIYELKLSPKAIFLTHNHYDHVSGVNTLIQKYPKIIIYGPLETKKYKVTNIVYDKYIIHILNYKFTVISTPGHTEGHISYYSSPNLFCGDTLFSGGCGKVDYNIILKMYSSLQKILKLPNNTKIYCSHEYTRSNLKFANMILPHNIEILKYYKKILKYNDEISTLPSKLDFEKKINPFLRLDDINLQRSLKINKNLNFRLNILIQLRKLKDKKKWS